MTWAKGAGDGCGEGVDGEAGLQGGGGWGVSGGRLSKLSDAEVSGDD